jgi:hypothetical protein
MLKIKSSICVVGNGDSLRDSKLGNYIDSHDYVIRINLYKIKGYEKDVGKKTTHWLFTESCSLKPEFKYKLDCKNFEEVWISYNPESKLNIKNIIISLKNVKSHSLINLKNPEEWSNSLFSELKNKLYVKNKQPTTGLIGIIYALKKWERFIEIAGFGNSEYISSYHYEKERKPSWSIHDLETERIIINKLAKSHILRRIDESSNTIS